MANTRKVLEDEFSRANDTGDFTAQPQATTAADVNGQDAKTRLWQSMNYTYGRQRDESNKAYDKAISQQDNALLGRGMQRSSYGMQTLANMQNDKMKAANDIYSAQIADYQNRIGQIEQQEQEADRWERQFAEGQRQFNENMGFQQSQADRSQSNWEKEFAAGREDADWNKNWQQQEANREQGNWQQQFDFTKEQWNAQQDQWKQEFDYNKMSDDQKLAYNYVTSILGQGGNPSDDLLARAGLTRADADAMKAKVTSTVGRPRKNDDNGNENPGTLTPEQLAALLSGSFDTGEGGILGLSRGAYNADNKVANNNNATTQYPRNYLKREV